MFGMYVLSMLDHWREILGMFLFVATSALLVLTLTLLANADLCEEAGEKLRDYFAENIKVFKVKFLFKIWVGILALYLLMPTTRQAAFIIIAPQIIENGEARGAIKNIPELAKLGTDYLKEVLRQRMPR